MATSPSAIGRYQVVRRLGAGGMGSVFLARDPDLDRHLAIKLVKDDLTDDPEQRERFSREARSAARLRHPNIVTIFDIGDHEGRPFIAMEYVAGESLAHVVRRREPVELGRLLTWMEGLCGGLAHAHRAGIVHRDIKPANLMVDADGVLKIVDFGIARLADSHMTREGVLVGTINYMAPEQILGAAADHRADVFAVGAVFYELLSFEKAFPGSIADGLFTRICHEPPRPLTSFCPDLDEGVARVVAKAIDKDPARRFQDLSVAARDLAAVRSRLAETGALGGTLTIVPADAAAFTAPTMTPIGTPRPPTGVATFPGGAGPTPQPTDPSLQRIIAELDQRDRSERLRQSAVDAARRIVDEARGTLEAGEASGALAMLDAVRAPTDDLKAEVAELRTRIGDAMRQRQRRAEIFLDAAEMALAEGDVAKAGPLVEDAARVDPTHPTVATLREQVARAAEAERAASAARDAAAAALRDATAALEAGDFDAARGHARRALAADPRHWPASALLSRIQQAERLAAQRALGGQAAAAAASGGRLGRAWIVLAVAIPAAAVLLYLLAR